MNDCSNAEVRDLLPDFVHGTLDATAGARVASHLRSCADCAAEEALLRVARAVLQSAPRAIDVDRITAALPRASVSDDSARRAVRRSPAHRWRAAAAVVAVAAGAATFWLSGARARPRGAEPLTAAAPAGGTAQGASAPSVAAATTGISLAGSLEDLTDEDLTTLLEELGGYEASPSVEPEAEGVQLDVEGVS